MSKGKFKYKLGDQVYWLSETYTGGHLSNVVLYKGRVKAAVLEESEKAWKVSYKVHSTHALRRGFKDWQRDLTDPYRDENQLFATEEEAKKVFLTRSKELSIEEFKGLIYGAELKVASLRRDIESHTRQLAELKKEQKRQEQSLALFKADLKELKKMSSFWVNYLDCSFKCSKRAFNKISKEFKELYDNKDLYQYFSLSYDSKEKKGVLELKYGEVGWHFDDELVDLNSICTKYDTCLRGYYTGEAEGADFRVDIDGSLEEYILDSAGTDWLLGYTAEEIRQIKLYAEDKFGHGNH